MKKRWVFTGVAGLLGALFLGCVLWVGGASGWFGLGALAAGEEPAWGARLSHHLGPSRPPGGGPADSVGQRPRGGPRGGGPCGRG